MGKHGKQQPHQKRRPVGPLAPPVLPYSGPTPTVCLSIIVKNESKVITRMLETVWPILDRYLVVDTGSTDGTQDIIRAFFAEKGIPGEVVDHEWVSFEDARNTALNLVKDKADFGFWIDADETLTIDPSFNAKLFKRGLAPYDGGNMKVWYGGQEYFRMQFFSTKKPWRWYGKLHEVLVCDEQVSCAIADGLTTVVHPDGNSWTSESLQSKYEGHARILEKVVAEDEKKDPRWYFYLAQSYRDANTPENLEKSLKWYRERLKFQDGYWEELYYSQLMVATLRARLGHHEHEVMHEFITCGKHNRMRIEHLMAPLRAYHHRGDFETSYIFSSHAMRIAGKGRSPFPHSSLFIDKRTYEFEILNMHMLNCWYTGRHEESAATYKKLEQQLKEGKVPADMIELTKNNGTFFKLTPQQLAELQRKQHEENMLKAQQQQVQSASQAQTNAQLVTELVPGPQPTTGSIVPPLELAVAPPPPELQDVAPVPSQGDQA